MPTNNPPKKTLQEIEGTDWGEPTYNSSLIINCHRLRRVPVEELSTENLRLLIGQQIGLPHLVPLAIETLLKVPFAQGDMYAGDLLLSVTRVPRAFWDEYPELRRRMQIVVEKAISEVGLRSDDADGMLPSTLTLLTRFKASL